MSEYKPTSRRPIADVFRLTAQGATRLCVRYRIHPDAISYLSIVAAAIAAILFWKSGRRPSFLLFAPAFSYLRLWFNMLDGMVALAAGKGSWRGEILNDLPDRVSDVLIFAGVAHSGWMNPIIGYWAAIFALLTAYVGMFGQAVGVQREFSGVMAKPWRMVTVHLAAWITFGAICWNNGSIRFASLTIFDWACLTVVAGCLQTIAIRLKRIMAALRAKSAAP
ncbi:MAG: CDP-diacylglycerol--glycerol-3-phosphate 3-phosphatidyltransferase [Chthoniobacterales bacterium]|nr:MAG: CDP-diacylglycerol--glycerol-3-phosphate 3-phosphatidyltransferase [Chthoniobacterales bacterium]